MKEIKVIDALYEIAQGNDIYMDTNEFFRKLTRNINYKELIEGLNSKIEIIEYIQTEDKKILEKLQTYEDDNKEIYFDDCYRYIPIHKDSLSFNEQVIVDKINEIIDKVNKI